MTHEELRQLEANEAWLATFSTPGPREDAIVRTKALVRREAARGESRGRFGPARGFWAAAAMIAISAGLVWEAGTRSSPSRESGYTAMASLTALQADPDEAVLSSLAGEVSEIGDVSSLAAQSPLEGLMEDVKDLETENGGFWDS